MNIRFLLLLLFCALLAGGAALADSLSERNGFVLAEPHRKTKEIFRVTAADAPLLDDINAASDSIAAFIIEQNNLQYDPAATRLLHVMPEAVAHLRAPPVSHGDTRRSYAAVAVGGWRAAGPQRLGFAIEYADPQRPRSRYLDHYVFLRSGDAWYFERHGEEGARSWEMKGR